jgi:hypothetical protein
VGTIVLGWNPKAIPLGCGLNSFPNNQTITMTNQISKPKNWEEDKENDKHQRGYHERRSQVVIHKAWFGKKEDRIE